MFKIAADADKASEYLFERFRKVYDLQLDVELIPDRKKLSEEMDSHGEQGTLLPDTPPFTEDAAKEMPVL